MSTIIVLAISLSCVLILTATTNYSLIYAQNVDSTGKLVNAGQGNATDLVFAFIPQNVEIKAGETITWDNPNVYAEPHSVTFLNEKKYFADFAMPFHVANSSEFQPVDPNSNSEPLFAPSQPGETTKTVVTINARAYIPTVIDSSGKNVTYLQPNSNYAMDGTESYVNSGWLWPEGKAPPGSPPISKFTVTFQAPGTYSYLCNVHPWMAGSVLVK
jgi:plastocyanin